MKKLIIRKWKYMKIILGIAVVMIAVSSVWAGNWDDNPSNWKNSESNWKNNQNNWKNSPNNWENSPNNFNRKNGVYDEDGNSMGYTTKKAGGGTNIYTNNGKRVGYSSDEE